MSTVGFIAMSFFFGWLFVLLILNTMRDSRAWRLYEQRCSLLLPNDRRGVVLQQLEDDLKWRHWWLP